MEKIIAHGHTFQDQRAADAYGKMRKESRSKALARKKSMTYDQKEKSDIRKHFNSESKHFNLK